MNLLPEDRETLKQLRREIDQTTHHKDHAMARQRYNRFKAVLLADYKLHFHGPKHPEGDPWFRALCERLIREAN